MNEAKLWFWILLDSFLVVLVIAFVCMVMPALLRYNNLLAATRTISVSAEGKTTASPDIAELSFSVLSQGQNPQTLTANNTDKMNAVLDFVKSEGIADADTKTTGYNLSPDYRYDSNTQRSYITGYTLTQTVTIKVRDLTKVAEVLGGLAPLGVNQIGGVNFTFDDPNTSLAVARADAFVKAQAKAVDMAREAGVSLGQVLNVAESGTGPVPYPYYAADKAMGLGGAVASAPTPTIQPGTQDVTDNVTITYALR